MNRADDSARYVAALQYIRNTKQFVEFDHQERAVRVGLDDTISSDEAAAHIGYLRDLKILSFYGENLTDIGLGHLHRLRHLQELHFKGGHATAVGLAGISHLPQLEELAISDASHLDGSAFEQIAGIPNLTRLSLFRCNFRDLDLAPLAASLKLHKLSIGLCKNIDGTFGKYLIDLPSLNSLSTGENVSDEALESIGKLVRLETLFLKGPMSDVGLRNISSLARLESLFLTASRITPVGLDVLLKLPRLVELAIKFETLDDSFLAVLTNCRTLRHLLLFSPKLTESGLATLQAALPECEFHIN